MILTVYDRIETILYNYVFVTSGKVDIFGSGQPKVDNPIIHAIISNGYKKKTKDTFFAFVKYNIVPKPQPKNN